ncbi:MAG: O-antigen ligase family protein [Flavobacteriaceae bacterium]|nr:O-antigen ligase family protein [Flavobacteriaceae bacterium]
MNINLFRAIPYVNYQAPKYGYYNESDVLLGAVLPILCFVIITLKVLINKKKINYKSDIFDVFIVLLTVIMVFSILVSPSIMESIKYTSVFLFLGAPFYFITKLYFFNTENKTKSLAWFIGAIVFFAILFSIESLYLHSIAQYPYERMTFPGVYPIPFCLFLCSAILIIVIYYMMPTMKMEFSKKAKSLFSLPILAIIAFAIIKTNTRGPVFALILAFFLVFWMFFRIKFNPKIILGSILILTIGFIVLITVFDINKIASRFITLTSKNSDSFSPRLISYLDAINVLITKPWGISVSTFGEYSSKDINSDQIAMYPHNLFMEFISSFGIVGLILCVILIIFCFNEYNFIVRNQKKIFSQSIFFLTLVMLLFYFIETQFSFTLNTHKGWYLSMALYSVFKWDFIKNNLSDEK